MSGTAILVHGGFNGGWVWRRVGDILRADGWQVYAPSLTGLGDRVHLAGPEVDLETHIQDVLGIIEAEELTDVVVVGHSAGGMVITGAADRAPTGTISGLLYLDASLPADGQSMLDFMGDTQGVPDLFRQQAADRGEGWRVPAGEPFDAAGFGIEDQDDQAWFNRHSTDHPLAVWEQELQLTGAWERVPHKTYIRCEGFQIAHGEPTIARVEADDSWHTERWDTHHTPQVTHPERVAEAIRQVGAAKHAPTA